MPSSLPPAGSSTKEVSAAAAPSWQLGIAIPALFATNSLVGSAGVERRLTDHLWLLVDFSGAVQRGDDAAAEDGSVAVTDGVSGGVHVGARWYVLDEGRVRPSLRASAGLGAFRSVVTVQGSDDQPQETTWSADASAGVDVDVFLVDNVAFRLGTSLLGARLQWGERTLAGETKPASTFLAAKIETQPSAALRVFF
jgi:hypothetical protein